MGVWTSAKAPRVFASLLRIGWTVTATRGSHKRLEREGYAPYSFAFHDGVTIGPKMLARIAKKTGLRPEDL